MTQVLNRLRGAVAQEVHSPVAAALDRPTKLDAVGRLIDDGAHARYRARLASAKQRDG
jgi:hypothetical protein